MLNTICNVERKHPSIPNEVRKILALRNAFMLDLKAINGSAAKGRPARGQVGGGELAHCVSEARDLIVFRQILVAIL
jgi:hypothetical protein